MEYYVLALNLALQDAAILAKHPAEVEREFDSVLRKGVPLKRLMPPCPGYAMSEDYPERRALQAFQTNTLGLLVVSQEAREVLESGRGANIEFLPIRIIDHRGKVASAEYSIANVLGTVDCMDRERSVFKSSHLDPNVFTSCRKLVLREENIPADVDIFRLSSEPTTFLVTHGLKERLEARGLRGMLFVPIEEYNTIKYL